MSVAALTVMTAVAVFAALGGIGLANGVIGVAQYQYGKKVTICHKGKTITVSQKAWPAHQRHGDTLGPCTTSTKKKNHGKHKGESKHAPNPATGSGRTTTTSTTTTTTTASSVTAHGNSGGNGKDKSNNGGGNGKGNGKSK
jgi:hypothetical protein